MRLAQATRLTLLLFLATAGCSGSASAQSLGRQSVHPRGVDGAVVERTVEVRIDAQGRRQLRERRTWEILTDFAMDNFADPVIWFDRERQTLDVATARTTMVDGTVVETPDSGFNELLPSELLSAPAYGAIRRTVVTQVGVEPGARAELDYTVADREPTGWAPGGAIAVAGPLPAAKTHVAITSAQGSLRSACLRCPESFNVQAQRSGDGHTYDLTDLPPLNVYELGRHGGDLASASDFVPRIVYSGAASWAAEVEALAGRVGEAAAVTDPIRERAAELARDEATEIGRIEAVQAFVARSIDTVRLDLWRLGFAPVAAGEVLTRSYGSELDKGVLLLALLRALEVEAGLALMSRDSRIATGVPWLGQLGSVWVVARTEGGELWMPVSRPLILLGSALPGDAWVLRLDRPGDPVRQEPAAPEASATRLVVSLSLDGDGSVDGRLRLSAGGTANPYFSYRAGGRSGERALSGPAASMDLTVEGGSVTRFGPLGTAVEGRLTGSREPEAGGTVYTLSLPWSPPGGLDRVDLREERSTPLVLSGPLLHSVRVTVELPRGWQLLGGPSSFEVCHGPGRLIQRVTAEDGRIEVTRELALTRRVVEPGEYAQLREVLVSAARMAGEVLIVGAEVPR